MVKNPRLLMDDDDVNSHLIVEIDARLIFREGVQISPDEFAFILLMDVTAVPTRTSLVWCPDLHLSLPLRVQLRGPHGSQHQGKIR
jgi:hypothetical protein